MWSSLWIDDNVGNFVAATALIAYLGHKIIVAFSRSRTATTQNNSSLQSLRSKSRLLKRQFGVIVPDDVPFSIPDSSSVAACTLPTAEVIIRTAHEDDRKEQPYPFVTITTIESNITDKGHKGSKDDIDSLTVTGFAPLVESTLPIKSTRKLQFEKADNDWPKLPQLDWNRTDLVFLLHNDIHPGFQNFWRWYDVERSLFRILTATRKDGVIDESTIAPYHPSSRRGNVPIQLYVTNDFDNDLFLFIELIIKASMSSRGRYHRMVANGNKKRGSTTRGSFAQPMRRLNKSVSCCNIFHTKPFRR